MSGSRSAVGRGSDEEPLEESSDDRSNDRESEKLAESFQAGCPGP